MDSIIDELEAQVENRDSHNSKNMHEALTFKSDGDECLAIDLAFCHCNNYKEDSISFTRGPQALIIIKVSKIDGES